MNGIKVGKFFFPLDRYYFPEHTWLKIEDGLAIIGLDAFVIENAGYLSYIEIEKSEVKRSEAIGSYESAKFVSRIFSPISGKILFVNEAVIKNPRKINENPYENWLVKIMPAKKDEIELGLTQEKELRKWIKEEEKKI
ncbi:MAG: glycine cleavage system protein H [Candidatus Thermoplasmatota archaeon]